MEIRQLEHLVAAVEAGTLGQAAEQSHISQPGLSMSLQRLEEAVGCALLERHSRGVTPTPAGSALYRHAKVVLSHLRHATAEVEALSEGGAGELRIGVGPSFMNRAVPRALAKLLDEHPGLSLRVIEGVVETQVSRVLEGELDLVFARFPSSPPHPELVY